MPETVFGQFLKLRVGKSKVITGHFVLLCETGLKHRRIVRIEHQWNTGVVQSPHRMSRQARHGAGRDIARDADFERHSSIAKLTQKRRIFDAPDPVADAFCAQG